MAKSYMSKDARKVVEKFHVEQEHIFDLEIALNRSFPKNINALAKKKDIKASIAMASKGFFKSIPLRTQIEFNETERRVYKLLTLSFLEDDFNYSDFEAIGMISKYSMTDIYIKLSETSTKNIWYLNKVLQNSVSYKSDFVMSNELDLEDKKGAKSDLSFMEGYET